MTIIAILSGYSQIKALATDLAPLVPECPMFIMRHHLTEACRQFLSDSKCWRDRNVTLLTTVANQAEYDYSSPSNATVQQVHSCWDGSTELGVALPGEEDDSQPGTSDSKYVIGVVEGGAMLKVTPAPETAGIVLQGSVSYTLAPNSTAIPTWIFDEYHVDIAHGAAADLVMQAGKPWTNPGASAAYMARFNEGVRRASNEAGPVRRRPLRTVPA